MTDRSRYLQHSDGVVGILSCLTICYASDSILFAIDMPAGSSEPELIRLPEDSLCIEVSKSFDARRRAFWAIEADMLVLIELT